MIKATRSVAVIALSGALAFGSYGVAYGETWQVSGSKPCGDKALLLDGYGYKQLTLKAHTKQATFYNLSPNLWQWRELQSEHYGTSSWSVSSPYSGINRQLTCVTFV